MKTRSMHLFFGACLALTLAVAGCGSTVNTTAETNAPTTGITGTDGNGNKFVGAKTCIGCHEGNANLGAEQVASYLQSKHVLHSGYITAAEAKNDGCGKCHDPVGDGAGLADMIDVAFVPDDGLAAVGCEACHGGGGQHYGKGAMPYGIPGPEQCAGGALGTVGASCHGDLSADPVSAGHKPYHPNGMSIYSDYISSGHATVSNLRNSAKCTKCHNHEGAREYAGVTAAQILQYAVQPVASASNIQCATCHDAHNPGGLLKDESKTNAGVVTASAEYNTCTNCHQAYNADLTGATDGIPAASGFNVYYGPQADLPGFTAGTNDGSLVKNGATTLLYHVKRFDRFIASNHYDLPTAGDVSVPATNSDPYAYVTVEGFVINPANEDACADCHNLHSSDLTYNKQWMESGHAGKLGLAKEAAEGTQPEDSLAETQAIQAAGSKGAEYAWGHYNWDMTLKADTTAGSATLGKWVSDRGQCQECHTATGFKAWADASRNGGTYDFTQNDFSYMKDWKKATGVIGDVTTTGAATVPSYQQELLYCWACHTDSVGGLRNPGAVVLKAYANGADNVGTTTYATLPDIGSSNLCAKCHGGRNNNDTYRTTAVASRSATRFAGHHAVTGGTVFAKEVKIGFEFTDANGDPLDYAPVAYFAHDKIGLTDGNTAGPCVSCHMGSGKNHTWEALGTQTIAEATVNVINNQAVCDTCHFPGGEYQMTYNILEEQKEGFDAAVALLNAYVANTAPFTNFKGAAISNAMVRVDSAEGLNLYGAVQNALYLKNDDPCAYVHNRIYAQRIVFDSINYLKNGNNTATTLDLSASPEVAKWFQDDDNTANDNAVARP